MSVSETGLALAKIQLRQQIAQTFPHIPEKDVSQIAQAVHDGAVAYAKRRQRGRRLRFVAWSIGTLGTMPFAHALGRLIDPDSPTIFDMSEGD
jgi:hypothetical protein